MRLPLLAATLAAAAATALPAAAMYFPVCATHLENAAAGAVSSCPSGNNPVKSVNRTLNVSVVTGSVQATITCFSPSWSPTQTATFSAGQRGTLSVPEVGNSCSATLKALSAGTTATGVSAFALRPITAEARS